MLKLQINEFNLKAEMLRYSEICSHWRTKIVVLPLSNFLIWLRLIWFNQCASQFSGTHFPRHPKFSLAPPSFSLAFYLFAFDFRCVGVKWREGSSKGKYNYTECSCSGFSPPRQQQGKTDKSKYLGKQIIWKNIFAHKSHRGVKIIYEYYFGKPSAANEALKMAKCTVKFNRWMVGWIYIYIDG